VTDYDAILRQNAARLTKAIVHLSRSHAKVLHLTSDPERLDDDELETWESFVARFGRVADIFLGKYLRTAVLRADPGFRGSLRDLVNQGEKLGLIDDAAAWMAIRELRNAAAHEYAEEKLGELFEATRSETPRLLRLTDVIRDAAP